MVTVLVVGVAGRLELERRMLDVEVPGKDRRYSPAQPHAPSR